MKNKLAITGELDEKAKEELENSEQPYRCFSGYTRRCKQIHYYLGDYGRGIKNGN